MFLSMAVLIVIVLATGEPVTWYWLLAIPVLLLQTIFNVGVGLFVARLGSQVNDFSQLLPFLLRTWMYLSGVMFSIANLTNISRQVQGDSAAQPGGPLHHADAQCDAADAAAKLSRLQAGQCAAMRVVEAPSCEAPNNCSS